MGSSHLEQLSCHLLTLIFDYLSWTSLGNVTFASTAFVEPAFASAGFRAWREMVNEEPSEDPRVEPSDADPEAPLEEEQVSEVVEIPGSPQVTEAAMQETAKHGQKRKLDDSADADGEIVRVVRQRESGGSPRTPNKRVQTSRSSQRVDTPVQMARAPPSSMCYHAMTSQTPTPQPQLQQQPNPMFVNPRLIMNRVTPIAHPLQQADYILQQQWQPQVQPLYQNYGFQHQAMGWGNRAAMMMPVDGQMPVTGGWQEQMMRQQMPLLQQSQPQPQQHDSWGEWMYGQW